jgi:hypothetical protein
MTTIAHPPVQCQKRTASAVLFLLLTAGMAVQAQQAVYRCGQEYTNAPREPGLCEALAPQAITVISGTRPTASHTAGAVVSSRSTSAEPAAPVASAGQPRTPAVPARTPDVQQSERDAQARTIVMQELDKARAQLAQLVQSYNQGEPEKWATETRNHQKYLDRVTEMKAAIERTERDIDSLQRELTRRPVQTSRRTP